MSGDGVLFSGVSAGDAASEPARALRLGPINVHQPLRTGLTRAPWSSMVLLSFVWFSWGFHLFSGGMALTFTVKRYNDDPQVLSLITTIAVAIMLGPFVSYISDQIWTRMGRRRPFMVLAWLSASAAMFGLAFLPELKAASDSLLGPLGIPLIPELWLIIIIVVSYTTIYDLQAPLEPLFLECVPPDQRGRFFAIRQIFFNCSVLFFFQILWPVFDEPVDMLGWLGSPGTLTWSGERMIYFLSGALFFLTTGYLVFGIEEVRVPSAPNRRFRDLGVWKFIKDYFRDVFLAKELYPFYIVLCLPGIENQVWGNFGALMQETQFGYTKANQALWGLPGQLLAMFVLAPFSGWYSDRKPRIGGRFRIGIAVVACFALGAAVHVYRTFAPDDIRELPAVHICILLNTLVALGIAGIFILVVEAIGNRWGREHLRAWVSMLAIIGVISTAGGLFILLHLAEGGVLPITFWMAYQQIGATVGALCGTFVGPMIYEYIPRNRIGTINAGRGIFTALLGFAVPNFGAWWVKFYTANIHAPSAGQYDYTSLYLLQVVLGIPGILATIYFFRLINRRRVLRWGVLEVEGQRAKLRPADPAPDAPPAIPPNQLPPAAT